jgi:hypothetical protein
MPNRLYEATGWGAGSTIDWLKEYSGCDVLEEGEDYFIYYKPYSKFIEKTTGRDGNIYVCLRPKKKKAGQEDYWVEYSDKEWPRMKTVPQHIKDRAKGFRDFYTLKAKITNRT